MELILFIDCFSFYCFAQFVGKLVLTHIVMLFSVMLFFVWFIVKYV